MQTTTDTHRAAVATAFSHHARPPILPAEKEHAWQRSFGDASDVAGYTIDLITDDTQHPGITVMRDARKNVAELEVRIGIWTCASITARLTPAELRELAARLLDAAHDIETLPAAVLTQAAA